MNKLLDILVSYITKLQNENDDLNEQVIAYETLTKFLIKRENKLEQIETMFRNKDVNLSILSEILKED